MKHRSAAALALFAGVALAAGSAWAAPDPAKSITVVLADPIKDIETCRSVDNDIGRLVKDTLAEGLTHVDANSGEVLPRLALSWEQTNDTTWRFHLREGVKFHDGTPFNADAVAYTIKRLTDPSRDKDPALTCAVRLKFFGGLTITTNEPDANTIDIITDKPSPVLPRLMSVVQIVPTSTPLSTKPDTVVGTGPFKLAAWPSDQEIDLVRNDDYWGDKPQVEAAKFVVRSESAVAAAMVQNGEADLAPYLSVQDGNNPDTDKSYLNTDTMFLPLSAQTPPLNDIRVRLAINLAIDRQAFVGTIVSKDTPIATQIVLPFVKGYNPDLPKFEYDPEKAKQLLAEAKADGVPVDTPIRLHARPGLVPNTEDTVAAIQQMLTAIGLNIYVQYTEGAAFNAAQRHPWPADRPATIILQAHDNFIGDAGFSVYSRYHSQGANSEIIDPEIDRMIDQAAQLKDDERYKLYQQVFAKAREDVADVPMFHMIGVARVGPRINYTPNNLTNSTVDLASITFK